MHEGINIVEEFIQKPIIPLHLGPIPLDITRAVITLWATGLVLIILFFIASRRLKLVPGGFQNAIESMVDFIQGGILSQAMPEQFVPKWFPLIATLFFFVLFSNLIGLLPPKPYTPNSNISVTAALALVVFAITHIAGIREQGVVVYFKNFVPSGLPKWMVPFMLVIHIISELTRPLSLAFRLYGNMLGGHVVLLVLASLAVIVFKSWIIAPLIFAGSGILFIFEIFVSAIQAYIFAFLSALYIGGAIHPSH